MKYTKRVSVGTFLKKGEDYKDGDILEIGNEGRQIEGQFGIQDIFLVRTPSKKEGNVGFNSTSINCMIDAFGNDSINWIGKKVKVWAILSNVKGKMIKVYYFTHPEAILEEDGTFVLPSGVVSEKKTENQGDIPTVEDEIFEDEE